MYRPGYFEESRTEALHALIRKYPFATLVTAGSEGLNANHIPFELLPEPAPFGTLQGHVARANPVWREVPPDTESLVIFHGPHSYISPSWYPSKRETGNVVPTWNYLVVHVYGRVRVIEDRAWLRDLVERLTAHYESGREEPWHVSDARPEYVERSLGAIVGLEMEITRLVGKAKLSQNRSATDQAGVVAGLRGERNEQAHAVADAMDSED